MSESEEEALLPERCPVQESASQIVRRQLDRAREKLNSKKIISLLACEVHLVNCELHGDPIHHIELVTSGLSTIGPEGMSHVIAALEAMLKSMKESLA